MVSSAEDVLGGTVVLLQFYHVGVGEIAFELQDVADGGAAPGVNGLVVITHHRQVSVPLGQKTEQHILGMVCVLVLVHQDVVELALVVLQHRRVLLKQARRQADQVVKVQGVIGRQALLVGGIDPGLNLLHVGAGGGGKLIRVLQLVLGPGDGAEHGAGGVLLFTEVQALEHVFDQGLLVAAVQDGKVTVIAKFVDVPAQNAGASGVEGADPDVPAPGADQLFHPLPHLRRRFVGEGNGQDAPGLVPWASR